MFADRDTAGPGVHRLTQIIREQVASTCRNELARAAETQTPA